MKVKSIGQAHIYAYSSLRLLAREVQMVGISKE